MVLGPDPRGTRGRLLRGPGALGGGPTRGPSSSRWCRLMRRGTTCAADERLAVPAALGAPRFARKIRSLRPAILHAGRKNLPPGRRILGGPSPSRVFWAFGAKPWAPSLSLPGSCSSIARRPCRPVVAGALSPRHSALGTWHSALGTRHPSFPSSVSLRTLGPSERIDAGISGNRYTDSGPCVIEPETLVVTKVGRSWTSAVVPGPREACRTRSSLTHGVGGSSVRPRTTSETRERDARRRLLPSPT